MIPLSFFSAKLKTAFSNLPDSDFLSSLNNSQNLLEAIEKFSGTSFSAIRDAYFESGDLRMCERYLYIREFAILSELRRISSGKLRNFINAILVGREAEILKTAIRTVFERQYSGDAASDNTPFLIREDLLNRIDYDALLNCSKLDEVLPILNKTPYAAILKDHLEKIQLKGTLFYFEVAVDNYGFEELQKMFSTLQKSDKLPFRRIISMEIDRVNLFRVFSLIGKDVTEERKDTIFLKGGVLNKGSFSALLKADRANGLLPILERYPEIDKENDLREMIHRIDERIYQKTLTIKGGNPFSFVLVYAYCKLLEKSYGGIISALYGRYYAERTP